MNKREGKTMRVRPRNVLAYAIGCACCIGCCGVVVAQDAPASSATDDASSPAIRQRLQDQDARIEAMRTQIDNLQHQLAQQEADYKALRHAVGMDELARTRGGNIAAGGSLATALPMPSVDASPDQQAAQGTPSTPVGQAPPQNSRPPEVAPIFQQPGVLTPKGKIVIEPAYQFGYSTADRVALVGYTIIPALLIGLIDVRQVRDTTQTAILTGRYGITNRLELEVRVPYVNTHDDTVSREVLTGTAENNVFSSSGKGLGDIEATARYQINNGGADHAYYIGWLRFKSRTGTDPFEVTTDCVTRCVQNLTGTGLPLRGS